MIMFLPDTGAHELQRLETYANGDERWGCAECGHTRLINFDPEQHRNECTQRGDFSVKHCMGMSCSPELDAAVRLVVGSHNTDDTTPIEPNEYSSVSCGIRWKNQQS